MTTSQQNELRPLISAVLDKTADDSQVAELEAMLRASAEARRFYLQLVHMEARLSLGDGPPRPATIRKIERQTQEQPTIARQGNRVTPFVLAAAACVVAVALFTILQPDWFRATVPPDEPNQPRVSDRIVAAQITGSVDCVWEETALPLGFGSSLYKGQRLELLDGTAEITFAGGAVVTLAGPARLVIDSESHASLRYGTLAVRVPKAAVGFAIQTPHSLVTDLGTEFGLSVSPAGEEEVHVFVGAVEVSLPQESDVAVKRLNQGEAVQVVRKESEGLELRPLDSSQRQQFPGEIGGAGDSTIAEPLPPDQHPPVTEGLTLWLSADGAIRRNSNNQVQVWGDMLTGDNRRAQNATQHIDDKCPRWIPDAMGDKPAISFDGNDVLQLATPSNLGLVNEDYEMFFVAQTAKSSIQFLIAGGYEDFELHINANIHGDPGVRFLPHGHQRGLASSDLGTTSQFSDGKPHIFAARLLANDGHRGVVAVDGEESDDRTSGDARNANNTSLQLGVRSGSRVPLHGEIAEVLIYRRALTAAERQAVGRYLAKKYQIETSY